MVKLFVGNLADGVTEEELKERFQSYGTVTECSVLGSYAFVHMSNDAEANEAIKNMDKANVRGQELNVERSKSSGSGGRKSGGGGRNDRRSGNGFGGGGGGFTDNSSQAKAARRAGCTKLHVANLPENTKSQDLRVLFERYGYVAECDVVEDRNIAFVHIESAAADAAIRGLNGREIFGIQLKVQMSKNQNNDPGIAGGMGGGGGGFGDRGRRGRGDGFGMGGLRGRAGGGGGGGFGLGDYGDEGYGYDEYDDGLPPPAKGRLELLELLDRRRRLEALDPYERRLIACPDPFNLPTPPPEYLRLLRERAMVKARLPLPPSSGGALGPSRPSAPQAGASTSTLQRALIARRAAAVAANAREKLRSSAGFVDPYDDTEATAGVTGDYGYGALGDY